MPRDSYILVVEDDQDLLDVFILMLESAGYKAIGACDGKQALKAVEEEMPDLIFLDMLMPVMDGWQFIRAFEEQHGRAVPVVVVTAAEHAYERAQTVGANDFLPKPFSLESVIRVIERHSKQRCAE